MNSTRPKFRRLSDYKPEEVDWFWHPLIPLGMTTLLEGDPNLGKSYLAMHFAARLSVGGKLPGGQKLKPRDTIYFTTKDSYSHTVSPRIETLGGNPKRIWVQEKYSTFDDVGLKTLRSLVRRRKPGLIVVDQLFGYVPAGRNAYSPNEIRSLMGELNEIGESSDAAVLLLRHLIKGQHGKAIYQGTGSIDVIGFARSAVRIEKHPDDPNKRLVVHLKWNLAEQEKSWVYEMVCKNKDTLPIIKWHGRSDILVDDLSAEYGDDPLPRETAIEFLRKELKDGPMPARYTLDKAKNEGIKQRTLDRAKASLDIIVDQNKSRWFWKLPDNT